MCVPCKIIINEENGNSAAMADTLRSLLLQPPPDPLDADDALYDLACAEVDAILAMRRQVLAVAKRSGASERWQKLMRQLYGAT
jgi:hypothetical protein